MNYKTRLLQILKKTNKSSLQGFFENLYKISLHGMGYGEGSEFRDSGEGYVIDYVKSHIKRKEAILFDVGANVGGYSQLLNKKFVGSTIYCFEPSVKTYKQLKINMVNQANIIPINYGLGEKKETKILYYEDFSSEISSLYKRKWDNYGMNLDKEEKVKIMDLDSFCKEKKIEQIDFLKIDVEGNELNVLKGAKKMLEKKKIRFIQFEFGGQDIDSKTPFRDFWNLLSKDYNFYRIFYNGLYPIRDYNEKREIYFSINYFCELKDERK